MCDCRKRLRSSVVVAGVLLASLVLPSASADAQETRTAEITKKQEEKAAQAAPYQPSRAERIMNNIEESYVSPPSGFFPNFGSVYPGGGLTLGVGYRHFYAREAVWEVKGLYSIKNYKNIEVGTRAPWNGAGRVTGGLRGGWRDATQVGFYGLGMDTLQTDRANFRMKQGYLIGNVGFKPSWWTKLEAEVAYEDFQTEEGLGRSPSIEVLYDPVTAPGLFSSPKFIHSEATAAIDWRPAAGYARKGGYYGATFVDYSDRDKVYSFQRVDAELVQHLPILRENWVLSFRGRMQSVLDDSDVVPYFLLPYLGSGSSLRGYPTGRFRDRHSLLTSAEFRWIVNRLALDMAFFYDAGKVASRREDLDFENLESDWGIGARFHSPVSTPLRIEMAKGADGWRLVFSSNAAF